MCYLLSKEKPKTKSTNNLLMMDITVSNLAFYSGSIKIICILGNVLFGEVKEGCQELR